jgi:hypothetical protein
MTVKITGVISTKKAITRVAEKTSAAELALIRDYAEKIAQRARDYAPEDEGDLVGSIETSTATSRGVNGRKVIEVGVNVSKLGPSYSERGFPYHIMMHEDPAGTAGNGPKSQAKAASLGVRVGPKYLTRALEDHEDRLIAEAKALAKKESRK